VDGREWLATVFEPGLRSETIAYNLEDEFLRRQVQVLRDCDVLDDAATRLELVIADGNGQVVDRFDLLPDA